ncbi:MAG: S41 family peptidase [Lachnospiraceae bacterium]|nr:S41 family peptidase [Lachnospiraceae bacterium]MBQ2319947.1 S41 family peptidase [Lachnospiraceae bacterium]
MNSKSLAIRTFLSGFITGLTCITIIIFVCQYTGVIDIAVALNTHKTDVEYKKQVEDKAKLIGNYIETYYFDDIDKEQMQDSVYKGIVNGLCDRYSAYYTEEENKTIMEKSSGVYCGIAAYIAINKEGYLEIVKPSPGGLAEKAGLKSGDIVRMIDGKNIKGLDISTIMSMVRGEKGTKVKFVIDRKGESEYFEIEVVREEVEDDTVRYKMFENNVGYISVSAFETVTSDQFDRAVSALERQKMNSLIVDLRDNGGGQLSTAVEMLDRIIGKGLVVYTKDKQGEREELYAEDKKHLEVPIVILVNGNSASASEVFAGALKDYDKAVLIGTKTFGKGIVQTIFNLKDGSSIKLTTSKYYTPKGTNIHGVGFEPDIKVEFDAESVEDIKEVDAIRRDNQIQAAIDYLSGQ